VCAVRRTPQKSELPRNRDLLKFAIKSVKENNICK
jgi:hypothetical protein